MATNTDRSCSLATTHTVRCLLVIWWRSTVQHSRVSATQAGSPRVANKLVSTTAVALWTLGERLHKIVSGKRRSIAPSESSFCRLSKVGTRRRCEVRTHGRRQQLPRFSHMQLGLMVHTRCRVSDDGSLPNHWRLMMSYCTNQLTALLPALCAQVHSQSANLAIIRLLEV